MPIRPIDLQTMIPKVQEHRQSKDATVNQSDTDQQQSNLKNKQLADLKQKQVSRMDRRDQMKIRDEGRRRQEAEAAQKKKDEQGDESTEENKDGEALAAGETGDLEKKDSEKAAYDKEKKLKSLQYHKFDMKV